MTLSEQFAKDMQEGAEEFRKQAERLAALEQQQAAELLQERAAYVEGLPAKFAPLLVRLDRDAAPPPVPGSVEQDREFLAQFLKENRLPEGQQQDLVRRLLGARTPPPEQAADEASEVWEMESVDWELT